MNYRRRNFTFNFKADTFAYEAERLSINHHEVILLMKFLRTEPQNKSMKIISYEV